MRRRGDVDYKGNAALLGDLGDGRSGAGVERADQAVRPLLYQPLGAGARGIDVGFRVGVHQLNIHAEQVFDHGGGQVRALLARLADESLKT